MGKFDGVLLVSDFDDTIYGVDKRVPPRNLEALNYFVSQGGTFTVATGRAHNTFAPYVHLTPINAPVILSNGSAIYDFQKDVELLQTILDERVFEDMAALARDIPEIGFEAYNDGNIYVHNFNHVTAGHMKKVGTDYTCCSIGEMPRPWTKVILQQEHPVLLRAREWMNQNCPGRYEAVFSNPYYLEVTDLGSTKGSMVDRVAAMLHIDPKHIYCAGDNQNDLSMLERSVIPFAPANCAPEVREWGAKVLCHCDDGLMGDIMEILDARYG